MKFVYASILSLLIATSANAQVIQDNFLGDNIIQNNVVNRPARVVKKVVRTKGKTVYNTYNIYNNTNNTNVAAPAPAPAPVPTETVVTETVVTGPVPYGAMPVYAPPPPPMPMGPPGYGRAGGGVPGYGANFNGYWYNPSTDPRMYGQPGL